MMKFTKGSAILFTHLAYLPWYRMSFPVSVANDIFSEEQFTLFIATRS